MLLKISICVINFLFLMFLSFLMFFFWLIFLILDFNLFIEWEILNFNSCNIVMALYLDWMVFLFMSFVLFISSLVIYYSKDYMMGDLNLNRFILLVFMFIISMMFLIISPNLISILLGWDGLGLVSYCLVIYYQNIKSFNAGMLTALSNRIGDVAFLMAVAWMMNFGSWNFIFYIEMMKMDFSMTIISFLIILAAMTKSAQIPFSSWLPAAMAAPTPVSALVHSSTLVTAGVYLLIRFNILFFDSLFGQILLLFGGLTMFMAGMSANFEFDLKKIIALSTLSQLGLMMMILSMGFPKLAFFHLLTHALFKALLFLCAGSIIHNMKNSQDIRDMGSLVYFMPLTITCLNTANFALCGMPFLAGFYSKDLILEIALMSNLNYLIFFLYFFSTGLTVCYSFRLMFYSLSGDFNQGSLNCLNEESLIMSWSMFFLLIMAIMSGSFLNWAMFSSNYFIYLTFFLKIFTFLICLIGGMVGYFFSSYVSFFTNKSLIYYLFSFMNMSMWGMPLVSTIGLIPLFLIFGEKLIKIFDNGWSEYFGGQKIYYLMIYFSKINQQIQNNNLKIYLLIFMFWMIILIIFLI